MNWFKKEKATLVEIFFLMLDHLKSQDQLNSTNSLDAEEYHSSQELMGNELEEEEEEEDETENGIFFNGITVYRLNFIGSVELKEEKKIIKSKRLKKHMVQEAIRRIQVPSN